ncbi:MAG: DUF4288 domain-containing protein, partial [Burkholderiales bacterium]
MADLVIQIQAEGDPRCVVHVYTVLVRACSPADAYEKSLILGEVQVGSSYLNPSAKRVTSKLVGLRDLSVVHEELKHGAELCFVERTDLQPDQVASMARPRSELSVFAEIEPTF